MVVAPSRLHSLSYPLLETSLQLAESSAATVSFDQIPM